MITLIPTGANPEQTTSTTPTSDHPLLLGVPGRWTVDPSETHANFVAHTLWGRIPVRGSLATRSGHLLVEATGASGELVLDAASVDTGIRLRNLHLRARAFFDASRHSDVRFVAHTLTALAPDRISLAGELTVAGHTAPIGFECATWLHGPQHVELAGQVRVDRRSFSMSGGQLPGMIPAEVELSVVVVLERASAG
jgi:polyisoprenoid-binding protein YceI